MQGPSFAVLEHSKLYAWFILSDSLPGSSVNARRAARRIVRACVNAEAEVVIGMPAKVAAKAYALAPSITTEILAATNLILPAPAEETISPRKGYESETRVSRSWLT